MNRDSRASEFAQSVNATARAHGLDDSQTAALGGLMMALFIYCEMSETPGELLLPEHAGELVEALADSLVAEAFWSSVLSGEQNDTETLEGFAGFLAEHTSPSSARRAGAVWLRARILDLLGRTGEVEALLDDCLRADPAFTPALELAARYASDRGDAAGAVRLLRRAGVTDDDEYLVALETLVVTPRRDIGRNEPCPCGSGRKYKQCHLTRTTLDLADRAQWLYRKSAEHVGDGPWKTHMLDIAMALRGDTELNPQAAWMALSDPLVADLVLIRDRAFDEFLTQRGPLLPVDERALAQRWADIDQSVFEITAVNDDSTIEVRDLVTGHAQVVPDNLSSRPEHVGRVFLARIVPVDDTRHGFIGGLIDLGFDDGGDEDEEEAVDDSHRAKIIGLLAVRADAMQMASVLSHGPLFGSSATVSAVERGSHD